jgi:hypothetical protein
LAGDLGERFLLAPDYENSSVGSSGDTEQAERIAEIAILDRREAAVLATIERDGVEQSDQFYARKRAWALAGTSLAPRYVLMLEAVAAELVVSERFRTIVDAIVPPLLEHSALSARAVRTILVEADPERESA